MEIILGRILNTNKGLLALILMVFYSRGTVKDNGLKFASYLGIKQTDKSLLKMATWPLLVQAMRTLLLSAKTNFAQNPKTNYRKDIDLENTVKSIVEAAKAKDYETLKITTSRIIKVSSIVFN